MKNKIFKIAAVALLPISASTFAADAQFTGTFSTIKNVSISETTSMVINGLHPAATSKCNMALPNATNAFPGETVMKIANVTAPYTLNAAAGSGAMSTDTAGCSSAVPGVVGIYEIDGAEGAKVKITLEDSASAGGLIFTAAGCVSDYDGDPDGDVCTDVDANATTSDIQLASAGDLITSAGQGTPEVGKAVLALGGSVITSIGLTAAKPYVVPFDVVVTY
ncbi:hypothetical protein [Paraglaciecola sp. L3A3]|uniref:hypothetical protein n=1 Tax=Paraglaciecola sp. L3A3 TaxID=2686358 RepID=UPI00131AE284|nr:hypothetical protein [Paraglaciecola sp. L3A3]